MSRPLPWLRLYSDFLTHELVGFLSYEDQRHFLCLLCVKSLGALDRSYPKEGMRDIAISRHLKIDVDALASVKLRLLEVGLIDENWQPTGWDERQRISDADPTNAARQRRFKASQKAAGDPVDRHSGNGIDNGTSNALPNGQVTPLDTEADTEADSDSDSEQKNTQNTELPAPNGVDVDIWNDFKTLRAKHRAPITPTAMAGIVREAKVAGLSLNDALKTCCERSWRGFKAEWLVQAQRPGFISPASATVPSRYIQDPTLARLDAEKAFVKPAPPEVRAMMADLTAKMTRKIPA